MKNTVKKIIAISLISILTFSLFADPPKKADDSLKYLEAMQKTFRSISATLLPSVVEVDVKETKTYTNPFQNLPFFGNSDSSNNTREYEASGLGSGVIVEKKGNTYYVVTNNHVAGSATKITVKLNDSREFEGKLVGADERTDIALVSFETKENLPVATLGDSDEVQTGDICFAMGAPLGYSQSVTQGIISATGRDGTGVGNINDFIQTDAAINQGNSGGPLINIYGEVIGINTWIASNSGGSQGLGFSIPINNIKNSISSFISTGKVKYGWVGVSLLEITEEFKKELGLSGLTGAFAAEVFLDSPAFKCGLRPGDFITSLNGKTVKNVNQLVREVGSLTVGSTATFEVYRGGKKIAPVAVKVEERTSEVENANNKLWPGFTATPLTDDVRKALDLDKKVQGVLVSSIVEKTAAATLRLQNNDVITAVNGKTVKNVKEFYEELSKAEKSINFDVYSNGGTITTGTYKVK